MMTEFEQLLDYELSNNIDIIQHKIYGYILDPKNKKSEITDDNILLKIEADFKSKLRGRVFTSLEIMSKKELILQEKRLHRKKNGHPRNHTFNGINENHKYFKIRQDFENWKKNYHIKEDKVLQNSYNLVWMYNHTLQLLGKLEKDDKIKPEMNYVEIILKVFKNWDALKKTTTLNQLIVDLTTLKKHHLENLQFDTSVFRDLPDPVI